MSEPLSPAAFSSKQVESARSPSSALPTASTSPAASADGLDFLAALQRLTKSGFKSTEFWLVVTAIALLAFGSFENKLPPEFSSIVGTVLLLGYKYFRAQVKATNGDQVVALADALSSRGSTAAPDLAVINAPAAKEVTVQEAPANPGGSSPNIPSSPNSAPPPPPVKGSPFTALPLLAFMLFMLFMVSSVSSCATNSGDPAKDARARGTNAVLAAAGKVLGRAAVATLMNVAQQEMGAKNLNLGSAVSYGLWSTAPELIDGNSIAEVISAFSQDKMPATADVAARIYEQVPEAEKVVAANEIASVISTAAGAPPAR